MDGDSHAEATRESRPLQPSSGSPRRPRLTSQESHRSSLSGSGSRSPRPRNAIEEYHGADRSASLYGSDPRSGSSASYSNPSSGSGKAALSRENTSSSLRGPDQESFRPSSSNTQDIPRSQSNDPDDSDFPYLAPGNSAVSNAPGMSGIGLASLPLLSSSFGKSQSGLMYSTSPPVHSQPSLSGVNNAMGIHFPRFGTGATIATTTTTNAAASKSRSRPVPRNYADAATPESQGETSSSAGYQRPSSRDRPRTGVSSGTSNSNSSTWSFFRSSSGQAAHRHSHTHSDSYSSIRERSEPMLSPIIGTSGVTTPQVYQGGQTTPINGPSGLNEELRRRIEGLRDRGRPERRSRPNYASTLVLTEDAAAQVTAAAGGSFLSASKRKGRRNSVSASSSDVTATIGKRKAEGLVAMAERETNTLDSAKVVIAGRNLLKIFSISQPDSEGESEAEEESVPTWNYARPRSPVPTSRGGRAAQIIEEVDLQGGSLYNAGKGSKAALINDVGWGFDYTADKIMTGNSNGTVALYDLGKGGSKLERVKTHHQSGRAINVVSFAGPSGQGTLLASGCQDGDIKLSDVRHASLITMATPLDPIRSFCFAPRRNSVADPFQLISAHESGNIARWDLRMPKNAMERLMAHTGGVLSIDWKGGTGSATLGAESINEEDKSHSSDSWGWLATAGMDGTVKVWDMSKASHTPHLVHTLHTARPAHFVRWHTDPNRPCDVIITPMPRSSAMGSFDEDWQPDIEIWDVRREHLPKQTFWTGGAPASCISPLANPDALWSLNRKTSAFQQIDTEREATRPIDYVPKVATSWSADGTLAFALPVPPRHQTQDGSYKVENLADRINAANQMAGLAVGIDPSVDVVTFRFLADGYVFKQEDDLTLADICLRNAEMALLVNRHDTAKIWRLTGEWLASAPPQADEGITPPERGAAKHERAEFAKVSRRPGSSASSPRGTWRKGQRMASPPAAAISTKHLKEGRTSHQSSPLVTNQVISEADMLAQPAPLKLPPPKLQASEDRSTKHVDLVGSDTSVESSMSESDPDGTLNTGASLSESDNNNSDENAPSSHRFSRSGEDHNPASNTTLPLQIRDTSKKRPPLGPLSLKSSREGSSKTITRSSSSKTQPVSVNNSHLSPARPSRLQRSKTSHETSPLQVLKRGPRPTALQSKEMSRLSSQRTIRRLSSESSASNVEAGSDSDSDAAHGFATLHARGKRASRHTSAQTGQLQNKRKPQRTYVDRQRRRGSGRQSRSVSGTRNATRSVSTYRKEQLQTKIQATAQDIQQTLESKFGAQLRDVMQRLADEGDVQTSATMACALRNRLDLDSQFLARITSAYLSTLRQLDCHLTSAKLTKESPIESIRAESQDNTTVRTACGNCEKAIHNAPFGKCTKCSAMTTTCCICHTYGTSSWIFCPTCGHGAHETCLYEYAADLSHSGLDHLHLEARHIDKIHSALPTPSTLPSSPQLAQSPASEHWLFPSEHALFTPASALPSRLHSRANSPDVPHFDRSALDSRVILLSQCPSGCGHSCLLTLPMSELPEPVAGY